MGDEPPKSSKSKGKYSTNDHAGFITRKLRHLVSNFLSEYHANAETVFSVQCEVYNTVL